MPRMETRSLGSSGLKVSALCLGAMTFGREADEATSRAIVDRFLDAGGNFVDTANVYSEGESEKVRETKDGTARWARRRGDRRRARLRQALRRLPLPLSQSFFSMRQTP